MFLVRRICSDGTKPVVFVCQSDERSEVGRFLRKFGAEFPQMPLLISEIEGSMYEELNKFWWEQTRGRKEA